MRYATARVRTSARFPRLGALGRGLLMALMLCALPALAQAQTGTLSGIITDSESDDVLPGANILLVELGTGAAADVNGSYRIEDVPAGAYTMRVSFIGYKNAERQVTVASGQTNEVNIALAPDYTGLDEVVVTGIASATSKARAEVAVSRVDATKYLDENAYQDVSQLLNGKVSGVTVQPASGNVAGGIRFVMRSSTGLNGDGQPVIYVDGVRIDNEQITGAAEGVGTGGQGVSMLANLNPEDIASIDVLKGPAGAALYGTSGSNGVILITTKRGQLGSGGVVPFTVTYKGVYGANQQAEEYDIDNAGTPDVANSLFRDGLIAQNSISVSGGSESVRYFTSYDKRFEEGHIRNNDQDRQSFRANFETFPFNDVTIRANTAYTLNEISRPQNDNNIFGYLGNTLLATSPFIFTDSTAIESLDSESRIGRFLGSVDVEYKPIDRLQLKAAVGFDATELRNDLTFPANFGFSGVTNGERNLFNRRNEQYTYDLNARYAYSITPTLEANTIIGGQAFNRILRESNIVKQNFSTELITNVGAGADFIAGDEDFLHVREAGIYAQQEFSLQNRLFFTLGLRRDFASTVGLEAPAIWYPKASFAVRLDQFGIRPGPVSFLKLRGAYGETGQLPGLLDASRLRFSAEPSGYGAGAVLDFIGNQEIEPERIREFEVGVEAELLDRIGLEVTGYYQQAENSIIDFENAPSTGLTASDVPFNVGSATGWGVESNLSATVLNTRNYGLDFNFLWSYSENEVDDLGGAQPIFDGFDVNVIKEGLPRDAFFTWSTRATFDENGVYAGPELTTTDTDGDGEPDRAMFGIPYPKHTGSFSTNVRFLGNFNLYVLTDWAIGNSIFNNTAVFQKIFGSYRKRNVAGVQIGELDAADVGLEDENIEVFQPGTEAYREAAETFAQTEHTFQGLALDGNFIEEADFFKLREVSLRYDFTDLLRRSGINTYVRNVAFTLSARNLLTFTPYSGADPEVNFAGARSASRATDFLTLPSPRVIYGTITLTL